MKKIFVTFTLVLVLVLGTFVTASAITDGEPDGDGHPYVGLLVFDYMGSPAWRCTGTLISPKVVLTAGHCTFGASAARVWFDSDLTTNTEYPFGGKTSIEASAWYTMPGFAEGPWYQYDAGIVILRKPVNLSEYGTLPELNLLDSFKTQRGIMPLTFTAVGYGLQESFPDAADWKDVAEKVRLVSYPELIQINVPGVTGDFSMLLSNNTNTGGTCFGDSGGPNFFDGTNIVAGITSFGFNDTCGGTGGVFRTDRANVQDFIYQFLP